MHALFDLPETGPASPEAGAAPSTSTTHGGANGGAPARRRGREPQELLDGLNGPQRDAVTHAGSPLLIVAGAGSGKTRVLTHRIAYLLGERPVHPGEILSIAFTNKGAAEMKARVDALVGRRAAAMWVSTFHSMCVRI